MSPQSVEQVPRRTVNNHKLDGQLGKHRRPSRHCPSLTWGTVLWGLGAGALVGDALQGREGHVQVAVGAGPEGAETVAVQVRVALRQAGCVRPGSPPHPAASLGPSQNPSGLAGPFLKLHPWTKLECGWGQRVGGITDVAFSGAGG